MHNANDSCYYNIDSIMFYDPSTSYDVVQRDIPAVPLVNTWNGLFNFNESFLNDLNERYETCGYKAFYDEAMTFPPTGPLPTPPNVNYTVKGCSLWVCAIPRLSLVTRSAFLCFVTCSAYADCSALPLLPMLTCSI